MDVDAVATGLATTVLVVLVGVAVTVTGFVPADVNQSLEPLCRKIARPALIFIALANADLRGLQWGLLGVLLLCKAAVMLPAAALGALVATRRGAARTPVAAVFAYCSVMSDDLALGLPVIATVYSPHSRDGSRVPAYLFLLAALQQLTLVPAVRAALDATQLGWRAAGRKALLVHVLRDRTVLAAALGVAANAAFDGALPALPAATVLAAANLYSGTALILVGSSLVGQFRRTWRGAHVWAALALALLKTLALPLAIRYGLRWWAAGRALDLDDDFVFLYGTLPAGYAAVLLAYQYGVMCDAVGAAFVLGMLISPPLLFVSSVLFNATSDAKVAEAVDLASTVSLAVASAAALYTLLSSRLHAPLRRYPLNAVVELALAQLVFGAAKLAGLVLVSSFARYAAEVYLAGLALSLRRQFTHGKYGGAEGLWALRAAAAALPAALVAYKALWNDDGDDDGDAPLETAFMGAACAVAAACLVDVQLQKAARHRRRPSAAPAGPGPEQATSPLLVRARQQTGPATESAAAAAPSAPHGGEGGVKFRLELLVALLLLGAALGVVVAAAKLSGEHASGALTQLELIVAVLVDGQGFFSWLLFATGAAVWDAWVAAWGRARAAVRRLVFRTDDFSSPAAGTSVQAVSPQLAAMLAEMRASATLVRDRTHFLRTYRDCFRGADFCDWAVAHGHAADRPAAVDIGHELELLGLLAHVVGEHRFADSTYFFRFKSPGGLSPVRS